MEPTAAYPSTVWKVTMPEGSDKQTGSVEKQKRRKTTQGKPTKSRGETSGSSCCRKTKSSKPRLPQTGEEASLGLGFLGLLTLGQWWISSVADRTPK